ncbi:chitinase-3-like protein 1 isoform X2 [Dermacentor silvarum]|uniref:chitinase-3-like protein 1 isoform X2 n=1 Tax=Dermacentor silvarum TaxID=543639 RepID=UPI002100A195|nr:chitinase-3-like protein 1 isoform X2 [Dermacentor silvarum]
MTEPTVIVRAGRTARCTDVRKTRSPVIATQPPPTERRSQRPREDDVVVTVAEEQEARNEAGPEGVPETTVAATAAPSLSAPVPQQQQRRVRKQATRIAHRLRQQHERREAALPRVVEAGFADRPPPGESSASAPGFTWVLSSLAGAFVTVSVLIGVVGFFVVNIPGDEHRLETVDSGWSAAAGRDGVRTSVVCYWNSSSLLRAAPKDYDLGKLCAHCCTHLVYMTAQLNPDGQQLRFPEDDTGLKSVRDMDALKTSHPQLKLVLSLRLEGSGVHNLTVGAEAPSMRIQLAERVGHWLSEFNFDGIEIDWDRLPVDLKPIYVDFVRAMRIEMKKVRLLTLVSVHMKWGPSYDVEALHGLSDLLIVHAYSKEDAPKTAVPPIIFKEDLVEACEAFLGDLRSRQRVALALPLFGYAYRLRNSARYELRAAVRGPAPPGPYTDERGLLAYFEICLEFSSDLWVSLYDKEADCKIAVNRDKGQWIGYDNKATILNKVLFAKRMRMGGIAVVTVDMDDYNGDCGQRNVLLGQLHNALNELDRPIKRLSANLSLPPQAPTTGAAGSSKGTTVNA